MIPTNKKSGLPEIEFATAAAAIASTVVVVTAGVRHVSSVSSVPWVCLTFSQGEPSM